MAITPGRGWIDRPDVPRASGFTISTCGNPKCGPHFLIEVDGKVAVEMVWSKEGALETIRAVQAALYCKAIEND